MQRRSARLPDYHPRMWRCEFIESRVTSPSGSTDKEGLMRNDLAGEDPKNIWLNQRTEIPTMTLKLIGQRSRELHGRTRRKLLGTLAGPLVVGFLYVFSLKTFPTMGNVLHPLLASALA